MKTTEKEKKVYNEIWSKKSYTNSDLDDIDTFFPNLYNDDNVLDLGCGNAMMSNFFKNYHGLDISCLLYTSPSPRDYAASRMPSSA